MFTGGAPLQIEAGCDVVVIVVVVVVVVESRRSFRFFFHKPLGVWSGTGSVYESSPVSWLSDKDHPERPHLCIRQQLRIPGEAAALL